MTGRSTQLAAHFSEVSAAFVTFAENCAAEQWRTLCPDVGWTVGASAEHVAGGMRFHAGHIVRMAGGRPIVQITMDQIDEHNRVYEGVTPDQAATVAALRANSARLAEIVSGLTDEQLALAQPIPFVNGGQVMSTAQMIEYIAIWHVETHHASMADAISLG